MRKLSAILLTLMIIICSTVLTAAADEGIKVTIDEGADLFFRTVDGLRCGTDPESGGTFSEIEGVETTTSDGMTTVFLPADNTYLIWLNEKENSTGEAYNASVVSGSWSADLIELFPAVSNPTLVVNSPSRYLSEESFLFEKLTVISQPDAFPMLTFNVATPAGQCTLKADPTFSILSTPDAARESQAEMVVTVFPESGQLSFWISAINHIEDYPDSKFMLHTRISCDNGEKTVSAKSVQTNLPVLHENGILFFDFNEFMEEADSFLFADLDGDDVYETTSAAGFFEFE